MKLSISRTSAWRFVSDEFEYYRHIRECGFRYIDYEFYSILGDDDSKYMQTDWQKQVELTRNTMEKIGVKSLIAHAPSGEPAAPGMTEPLLRRTIRSIECCGMMGIENLVYHPGGQMGMTRKEFLDFNVDYVRRMIPMLEKHNVTLLLENVGRWDEPFYVHDAEEMLELIDKINHPLYQACLDTGHLSLQDEPQYDTIMALGSHLRGLHVQDNFGSLPVSITNRAWRQDLHLPPLMGCVNFDEVLTGLKKIGYRGLFNLEPESPRVGSVMSAMYDKERRLEYIPLDLMKEYYAIVFDIAKYMLESYDLYEE